MALSRKEISRRYTERHPDRRKASRAKYEAAHPERVRQSRHRYRKYNAEKARAATLRHKYGMTVETYEAMLASQGGACAICRTVPDTRLHVDHCHDTGKIRGLLCQACNTSLGKFKDDPALLHAAAEYLITSRSQP